jgi:hypothetical protein
MSIAGSRIQAVLQYCLRFREFSSFWYQMWELRFQGQLRLRVNKATRDCCLLEVYLITKVTYTDSQTCHKLMG